MARHAPKPSPDHDDDPAVVDLMRYRKARQAQVDAKRRAAEPHGEPLLGPRKGAGLILAGCAMAMAALWLLTFVD
jgi:hypothetical protein